VARYEGDAGDMSGRLLVCGLHHGHDDNDDDDRDDRSDEDTHLSVIR
jgi:hypothetical protein